MTKIKINKIRSLSHLMVLLLITFALMQISTSLTIFTSILVLIYLVFILSSTVKAYSQGIYFKAFNTEKFYSAEEIKEGAIPFLLYYWDNKNNSLKSLYK